MSHLVIPLPERVFEIQPPGLLALVNGGDDHESVEIDISRVKFLIPAAIVAVLARCHRWWNDGRKIYLGGIDQSESLCPVFPSEKPPPHRGSR